MVCLLKHRRQHGWMCPRPHGNAVFCSFEQSDVGSLPFIETQKSSHWNEKRRHCLGPWSLTQPGVHISGNELKIECLRLFMRGQRASRASACAFSAAHQHLHVSSYGSLYHAQKVFPKCFFHCPSMQRFISRRSSSSVDLDSSSLEPPSPCLLV